MPTHNEGELSGWFLIGESSSLRLPNYCAIQKWPLNPLDAFYPNSWLLRRASDWLKNDFEAVWVLFLSLSFSS